MTEQLFGFNSHCSRSNEWDVIFRMIFTFATTKSGGDAWTEEDKMPVTETETGVTVFLFKKSRKKISKPFSRATLSSKTFKLSASSKILSFDW